jgi:plasmid stabilization system protein ParE
MSYTLSEGAVLDLDSIWDYIAEDSMDAADRWIGKLLEAFDVLGDTPGIGHKRVDLTFTVFCSGPWAHTSSSTARHPVPWRLWL